MPVSIVISGDTEPSDHVVNLADGAKVLVHAVMYPPAVDRLVARVPNAAALKARILAHQASAEDARTLIPTTSYEYESDHIWQRATVEVCVHRTD